MSLPNDADRARKGSARPRARWAVVGAGMAAVIFGATACVAAAGVANQILTITGSGGADTIVLRLRAGDPNILEVDDGGNGSADFAFDRQTFTSIDVEGGGGNDVLEVDHSNGAFTDTESTTLSGGDGNDFLVGDVFNERLDGGAGIDVIDGNPGSDVIFGGDDNDVIKWDPGDGSDVVEGGAGADLLLFNGSAVNELFDVTPIGGRVRLARNVASVAMDLNDIETVDLPTAGGSDGVTVNPLAGTDLSTINVDFAAVGGGDDGQVDELNVPPGAPISRDGAAATVGGLGAQVRVLNGAPTDRIHVTGTAGADVVSVLGTSAADAVSTTTDGTDVAVFGATPGVHVQLTAVERLDVDLGAGDDSFSATGNLAALVTLDVDGGPGADTLLGGNGADTLLGGDGNDVIDGNQGSDVIFAGDGADTIKWDPGDASDVVEGGAGADRLLFNGNGANELFDVSANGGRVRLTRNVASVVMDLNDVETVDLPMAGGTDGVTVNDLSGTDVTEVNLNLAAAVGGGDDGLPDQVVVNGTAGNDTILVDGNGPTVGVFGLAATVNVTGATALDRLTVNGLDGTDTITVSPGSSALIQLVFVL